MKKIYVAGKYSADNVLDVLKNIGRGQFWASELFNNGYAPFCPWHDKQFAIDLCAENLTVKQFYDYSMAWLEVSDAVFLVPGWEESKGTLAEIERASELDIPVFAKLSDLEEWAA